ncbi:MAG: hypothetical protein ABR881_19545 [Candidatus Sulfotelmatobacter sp.]|jgi:hypothetical protein
MAPSKEFEKALHEALSAITPTDEASDVNGCPEPEAVAGHVRLINVDNAIGQHLASCPTCGQLADDIRRRQRVYEQQKTAFTKLAEQKYPFAPVLTETFRPFAWMLHWKALVPEVAVAIVIFAVAFNFHSVSSPDAGINAEANSAVSTITQIEKSDPRKPADTAVLLEKFRSDPELVGQIDASRVAQARVVVGQKKAAVASDAALADQWSDIEGKLQGYEFIAHYNSLRRQAEGSGVTSTVADVQGKNGNITISFDRDPMVDSQDSKLLSTSAVETQGLNQVTILSPQRHWKLDSRNDFEAAAADNSHQTQKPQ